jgi:predicted nuclease of predicted toxin-antitoxin system
MISLLLDENISPAIIGRLCNLDIDAVHIRDRAMLGAPDRVVWRHENDNGRTLVTINLADFASLCKSTATHCGVIAIPSGGRREHHLARILAACAKGVSICDPALPIFATESGFVDCNIYTKNCGCLRPIIENFQNKNMVTPPR